MFKEVLKIIPKMDAKDIENMQRALQSRFTKLAKSFSKGIAGGFKSLVTGGLALGLIDKVLNPLQDIQEAIDKTLSASDDISTNATQFNTTSGKLFKLVQLAKATGLDEQNLFMLINKFQTAVAQAKSDPTDESVSAVRNFVGETDTAQGFFNFINALKKMDKNTQILAQAQIFGEKQTLKMAEFLQTDFAERGAKIGLTSVTSEKLTKDIDKLAALNDLQANFAVRRETLDVATKARNINESMIIARNKSEEIKLKQLNDQIKSYSDLAAISKSVDQIMGLVQQGVGLLGGLISKLTPAIEKMAQAADKFMKSPMIRGVKSLFGGKEE